VNFNVTFVVDVSKFSKPVHKKTNASASGTNHLRQHFLANLYLNWFQSTFLVKIRQRQKNPSQPFLARVEKLIHQILL